MKRKKSKYINHGNSTQKDPEPRVYQDWGKIINHYITPQPQINNKKIEDVSGSPPLFIKTKLSLISSDYPTGFPLSDSLPGEVTSHANVSVLLRWSLNPNRQKKKRQLRAELL